MRLSAMPHDRMQRGRRSACLAVTLIISATACRGSITNPYGDEGRLTSIDVSAPVTTFQVGDTVRLTAIGHVSGVLGVIAIDRLTGATWTASDASLVQLTVIPAAPGNDTSYAQAIVRGTAPGTTLVTVSAREVSASVSLHVTP
jgi:hypothetical protein